MSETLGSFYIYFYLVILVIMLFLAVSEFIVNLVDRVKKIKEYIQRKRNESNRVRILNKPTLKKSRFENPDLFSNISENPMMKENTKREKPKLRRLQRVV